MSLAIVTALLTALLADYFLIADLLLYCEPYRHM